MSSPEDEALTSAHSIEYTYSRSLGPVVAEFLTGLRDGRIFAIRGSGGAVIVPPCEYDPLTAEELGRDRLVEVGPRGTVESSAWVFDPLAQHPLEHPFAWVLVRLDGATTSLLHVLDSVTPERVVTGLRVEAEFRPISERVGRIQDIRAFVPSGSDRDVA